jgi:hypothetical protein
MALDVLRVECAGYGSTNRGHQEAQVKPVEPQLLISRDAAPTLDVPANVENCFSSDLCPQLGHSSPLEPTPIV